MDRIKEVQQQWMSLGPDKQEETFASIWAKGEVGNYFRTLSERALGLVRAEWKPSQSGELKDTDLNPYLLKDLSDLIEDAIDYIEWTLNWPTMVQVIRSVEQGKLQMDALSWRP